MAENELFERFWDHFSDAITPELDSFVTEDVLIYSRYLFVRRHGPFQYGYCTHCKTESLVEKTGPVKHNEDWKCKRCNSLVTVKLAGLGRGKMIDRAYVIWYQKSHADPAAIIATGYKVIRDYRDKVDITTEYVPVIKYLFQIGKASAMVRDSYSTGFFGNRAIHYREGWKFAATIYSLMGKHYYTQDSHQSIASIHKAVKDTRFQYSEWGKFAERNMDLVHFFSAFSKYPYIEYLSKIGMKDLVECIVNRDDLRGSINLRGKTPDKILGLSKQEMKEWKASQITMTPIILYTYKWFRDKCFPISWAFADACGHLLTGSHYMDQITKIQEQTSLPFDQAIRFVKRQFDKKPKRYGSVTSLISDWKDYLEHCRELQVDLTQERYMLPNNLYDLHQQMIRSIKLKSDKGLNRKIKAMQPKLKKYIYEKDSLMIRPAISSIEMFDEGSALDHCVGRYADRYATAEIVILFIRKIDDPDESFYTVEIEQKSNFIRQCRGLKNCDPTPEIKQFLAEYQRFITQKSKPSKRQEVAV
jgi:hypothetical protein